MGYKGDIPTPRSGHSFTHFGGVNYLLYGGIDNSKKAGSKIMPCNDAYTMKVGRGKFRFTHLQIQTAVARCHKLIFPPLSQFEFANSACLIDEVSWTKEKFNGD